MKNAVCRGLYGTPNRRAHCAGVHALHIAAKRAGLASVRYARGGQFNAQTVGLWAMSAIISAPRKVHFGRMKRQHRIGHVALLTQQNRRWLRWRNVQPHFSPDLDVRRAQDDCPQTAI